LIGLFCIDRIMVVKQNWWDDDLYNDADNSDSFSNRDSGSDYDESPSPSHECVVCGNRIYIQSEPRKRAPHYCERCDDVNYHVRIEE